VLIIVIYRELLHCLYVYATLPNFHRPILQLHVMFTFLINLVLKFHKFSNPVVLGIFHLDLVSSCLSIFVFSGYHFSFSIFVFLCFTSVFYSPVISFIAVIKYFNQLA
jgi:hypothetical protein